MTKTTFSVSNFIVKLEDVWASECHDIVDLNIDLQRTWPHFTMTGKREGSPVIKGHFVEGGTSFWQISNAGREAFTRDDRSCADFIDDIRAVIGVLVVKGCTETRWSDHAGLLVNAMITINVGNKEILFGHTPAFWKRGFTEDSIEYAPYCSAF